jgi:amidohydrolase
MKKMNLLWAMCLFVVLAQPNILQACRCAQGSVESAIATTPQIFVGTVTKRNDGDKGLSFTFTVSKSWKGNVGATVDIATTYDAASCGYGFEVGKTYIVFASGNMTDLCTKTSLLAGNEGVLTILQQQLAPPAPSKKGSKSRTRKIAKPKTGNSAATSDDLEDNDPLASAATPNPISDAQLLAKIDALAKTLEPQVIAWRRTLHQNPELSNREFKTAEMVAAHLRSLGIEVKTGVAKTGVVGLLKGGKAGPVVALRADMDALPVTERVPLPFASKVRTVYNGDSTGVMHACGHDSHVAILMATASVLSQVKSELRGTIKFIFQPSEEGAPRGEEGGAAVMIQEGVLENPKVEAIFGLHINSMTAANTIKYRIGGTMASSDRLYITVKGKQVHGASPWDGVDPIVTSAMIIQGLQTVVSRQTPLNQSPGVVTIGMIKGGNRENIIPESVEMMGTIRCLDTKVQEQMHANIIRCATNIAESQGATAEVRIVRGNPVTYNNPELSRKMIPSLEATAGADNVRVTVPSTGAEDFAQYQLKIPGLFFFLGGMNPTKSPTEVGPHHTPDFELDESGFGLGVRALCHLVVDYSGK